VSSFAGISISIYPDYRKGEIVRGSCDIINRVKGGAVNYFPFGKLLCAEMA